MNAQLQKIHNCGTLEEKNICYKSLVTEIANDSVEFDDIFDVLDLSFKMFKENFEHRNFEMIDIISKLCKDLMDLCLKMNIKEVLTKRENAELFLDIACFVFDETYKYKEKVNVLKSLIESEEVSKEIKTIALQNILSPEPETRKLIANDYQIYLAMLDNLQ